MSYDLAVIVVDAGADDAAVRDRIEQVMDDVEEGVDPGTPDPRIAGFYQELRALYPDDVDELLDDDALDEALREIPWAVFPLEEEPPPDHVYLCMSFSWAEEVYGVVSGLADKHGLVFYDPQEDEFRRPSTT